MKKIVFPLFLVFAAINFVGELSAYKRKRVDAAPSSAVLSSENAPQRKIMRAELKRRLEQKILERELDLKKELEKNNGLDHLVFVKGVVAWLESNLKDQIAYPDLRLVEKIVDYFSDRKLYIQEEGGVYVSTDRVIILRAAIYFNKLANKITTGFDLARKYFVACLLIALKEGVDEWRFCAKDLAPFLDWVGIDINKLDEAELDVCRAMDFKFFIGVAEMLKVVKCINSRCYPQADCFLLADALAKSGFSTVSLEQSSSSAAT